MSICLTFPSVLQYGDEIEITGTVGSTSFSLDLLSDYLAFDPVQSDHLTEPDDDLPLTTTQPLHITFELATGWDVISNSPETSSCSHGSSLRRYGFYAGQSFTCTISIRKEFFEVSLNEVRLASSEHLVPVGSIYGLQIDGDSMVEAIRYGHPTAVKNAAVKNLLSGKVTPVECRLTADTLLNDDLGFAHETTHRKQPNPMSRSAGDLYWSGYGTPTEPAKIGFSSLNHLTRSGSYQLVFDSEESEAEEPISQSSVPLGALNRSQNNMLLIDDPKFLFEDVKEEPDKQYYDSRRKYNVHHATRHASSLARKAQAKSKHSKRSIRTESASSSWNKSVTEIRSRSLQDLKISGRSSYEDGPGAPPSLQEYRFNNLPNPPNIRNKEAEDSEWDNFIPEFIHKSKTFSTREEIGRINYPHERKANTIAFDRPALLIRKPLSSLDRLWDAVLPTPSVMYDGTQTARCSPVACAPEDSAGMTGTSDLLMETDYEQDWREEIAYRYMNDIGDNDRIENKETDWSSHSVNASFSSDDYTIRPRSFSDQLKLERTINRMDDERGKLNKDSINSTRISDDRTSFLDSDDTMEHTARVTSENCSRPDKFHRTKVSQPILLMDYHTLDDGPYVSETENLVFNAHAKSPLTLNPWPNGTVANDIPATVVRETSAIETKKKIAKQYNDSSVVKSYTRSTISSQSKQSITKKTVFGNQSSQQVVFRSRLPKREFKAYELSDGYMADNEHLTEDSDRRGLSVPLEKHRSDDETLNVMNRSMHVFSEYNPPKETIANDEAFRNSGFGTPTEITCTQTNGIDENDADAVLVRAENGEQIFPQLHSQNLKERKKTFVNSSKDWLTRKFSSYRKQNQSVRSNHIQVVSASNSSS